MKDFLNKKYQSATYTPDNKIGFSVSNALKNSNSLIYLKPLSPIFMKATFNLFRTRYISILISIVLFAVFTTPSKAQPNPGCNIDVSINECEDIIFEDCGGPWQVKPKVTSGLGQTYQWKDKQGNVVATTKDFNTSQPGTYTLTVTDIFGCVGTETIYLGPLQLTSSNIIHADCHNNLGEITIKTVGGILDCLNSNGVPGFTFIFKRIDEQPLNQYLQVTPLHVSFTSSYMPILFIGITDREFSIKNLDPGKYTIGIWGRQEDHTDNDCILTFEFEIKMNIPVIQDVFAQQVDCNIPNTGSIMATATDGIAPLSYVWSKNGSELSGETSSSLYGLSAGTYTLKVTDAAGCTAIKEVKINPVLNNTNVQFLPQRCYKDKNGNWRVTIEVVQPVSAGTAPYTYEWSHYSDNPQWFATAAPGQNISLTITDANGCEVVYYITAQNCSGPYDNTKKTGIASPNPNNGNFIVTVGIEGVAQETDIKVVDIYNNVLFYEYKGILDVGSYDVPVNISSATPGTYYVLINNGEVNFPVIKN